jgi:hypothetical protein
MTATASRPPAATMTSSRRSRSWRACTRRPRSRGTVVTAQAMPTRRQAAQTHRTLCSPQPARGTGCAHRSASPLPAPPTSSPLNRVPAHTQAALLRKHNADLQAALRSRGLETQGRKKELVHRLLMNASSRVHANATDSLDGLTLLSLPKSGRTWLLCLLASTIDPQLSQDRSDGFLKSAGLHYTHDFGRNASRSLDRLVCSRSRSSRVLLLERDPRDWIISAYYEHKYRAWMWGQKTLRGNLTEHLPELVEEASAYNRAMHDAVRDLSCTPDPARLMVVRYETLVACASCVLAWLLPAIAERADAAGERCDFHTLRALNGTGKWGRALPSVEESNKFRSGMVGGWRQQLPQLQDNAELAAFERQQVARERRFGLYASTSASTSRASAGAAPGSSVSEVV